MYELTGASVAWTNAGDGDLGLRSTSQARLTVHPRPWLQLRQVHGARVITAHDLSQALSEADAAITARPNLTLAIATADCAPIALSSREGIIGAVHAGWKGLAAGVIEKSVESMRHLGATEITGALGPCIHAECYEFDPETSKDLAQRWGSDVVGTTKIGTSSLDMVEAVVSVCRSSEVNLVYVSPTCTACDTNYFSHRARKDTGRQVMLVWRNDD